MRPGSEAELAEIIRGANGPLRVQGGGTRGLPGQGELLETGGLSGISLYEPGALTLVAGAGTPMAEIEAALAEKKQRLAFEPMDHRALMGTTGDPTLGGVAAANISGPRRLQVGAARDHMLGVRFVDGAGRIVKNGGRVMKNVTGYDLVKLMAGSHGTLGVLTEVSLKLQAIPEAEATLILRGRDMATSIAALTQAMSTPFDVSGACWLSPSANHGTAEARIRIEGLGGSVTYRAAQLKARLGEDAEIIEGPDSATLWQQVRDVTPFAGTGGAVWKISTRPTRAAALIEALKAKGLAQAAIADWSGGLIWLLTGPDADAGAAEIRARTAEATGHATLIRAPDAIRARVPAFPPQPAALETLAKGLRDRFDPRGLFNPGLMETA
ncbi:FAD-binding protein [Pseudooceanicola sp. C21-150M6]|uniref:FAD-binding protein n=1 Tax=Pseudooceanicola sp. C21-150M6 TaxID=3434355 RepID=UPI003D7F5243